MLATLAYTTNELTMKKIKLTEERRESEDAALTCSSALRLLRYEHVSSEVEREQAQQARTQLGGGSGGISL